MGIPGVAIAVPSWTAIAKRLARSAGLLEKQVITIPIGKLFADSEEAGPVMSSRAGTIIPDIIDTLIEVSGGAQKQARFLEAENPRHGLRRSVRGAGVTLEKCWNLGGFGDG